MMKTIKNNFYSIDIRSHNIDKIDVYGTDKIFFTYENSETLLRLDVIDDRLDLDSHADDRLDAWCSFVDEISFDFNGNHIISAVILNKEISSNANRIIKNFCEAIDEYRSDMENIKHKIEISADSARNYLYLIPAFGRHSHHVTIDADTGFINIGFRSRHKELLTALVTSKGEVHYSFVGRGRKLVKISGTAKIKDKRDFISFKKILRML